MQLIVSDDKVYKLKPQIIDERQAPLCWCKRPSCSGCPDASKSRVDHAVTSCNERPDEHFDAGLTLRDTN